MLPSPYFFTFQQTWCPVYFPRPPAGRSPNPSPAPPSSHSSNRAAKRGSNLRISLHRTRSKGAGSGLGGSRSSGEELAGPWQLPDLPRGGAAPQQPARLGSARLGSAQLSSSLLARGRSCGERRSGPGSRVAAGRAGAEAGDTWITRGGAALSRSAPRLWWVLGITLGCSKSGVRSRSVS